MTLAHSITNLVESIIQVFQGLINSLFAVIQAAISLVKDIVASVVHIFHDLVAFFFHNMVSILVVMAALVAYSLYSQSTRSKGSIKTRSATGKKLK
ncbi:hypothetical protein T439DRAFT_324208 [Meredithblackwellia eburnea MCA 4105]